MNFAERSLQAPLGGRVDCREEHGGLVVHIRPEPWRMMIRFAAWTLAVATAVLLVAFVAKGWLPPILMFGAMGILFLTIAWIGAAKAHLTETFVRIARDHAVVRTSRFGRANVREYPLETGSRARQWYVRCRNPTPQGIEIGLPPFDTEAVSDPFDESQPRFGAGLSRGELDWLEWRINRFLGGGMQASQSSIELSEGCAHPTSIQAPRAEPRHGTRLFPLSTIAASRALCSRIRLKQAPIPEAAISSSERA